MVFALGMTFIDFDCKDMYQKVLNSNSNLNLDLMYLILKPKNQKIKMWKKRYQIHQKRKLHQICQ